MLQVNYEQWRLKSRQHHPNQQHQKTGSGHGVDVITGLSLNKKGLYIKDKITMSGLLSH